MNSQNNQELNADAVTAEDCPENENYDHLSGLIDDEQDEFDWEADRESPAVYVHVKGSKRDLDNLEVEVVRLDEFEHQGVDQNQLLFCLIALFLVSLIVLLLLNIGRNTAYSNIQSARFVASLVKLVLAKTSLELWPDEM